MPMTADQKAAAVQHLTTNCDCWKGAEATLNAMPDDVLAKLRAQADVNANNALVANAVKSALGGDAPASPEALAAVVNEQMCPPGGKKGKKPAGADDEYTDPADVAANRQAAPNPDDRRTPMGMAEALEKYGTPEDRAVWNAAVRAEKREKLEIVRQLVANIADPARRKARGNDLMKKPLGELEGMLELIPTGNAARPATPPAPRYDGQGGDFTDAPVGNAGREEVLANAEVLSFAPTNWADLAAAAD